MRIIADINAGTLVLVGKQFVISNRVRTLREGTRKSSEVIRSIPGDKPYDPQYFPRGIWRITGIEWQKDKLFDPRTYGPVKIRTDAWQMVKVWDLDKDGDYLRETSEMVRDEAYLLHYTAFTTTLGCIRLNSPSDAEEIAAIIAKSLEIKEVVELEV